MEIANREQLAAQAEALAELVRELDAKFETVSLMCQEMEMARERIVDGLLMENLLVYGDGDTASEQARKIESEVLDDVMPIYNACLHLKWAVHMVEPEEVDDDTFRLDFA